MHSSTSNGLSSSNAVGGTRAGAGSTGIQNGVPKEQPQSLEQQVRELQTANKGLQDELKKLQEQDFNARKKEKAESHHVVASQFIDVFRMSTDWARDYFRIDFGSFRLDEHKSFKKHLDRVMWKGCDWAKKEKLNVSHLVQAVVAEVLSRRILLSPFAGCAGSSRHEFSQLYDALLKGNKSRAYKWRATTLSTYEMCGSWAPFSSSAPPEPIARYRQYHYEKVADEIDSIVGSIAKKHFPDTDPVERREGAMEFIRAAGNLAVVLGSKAAELQAMDKAWFERSQRAFVCNDEKMKGRFEEEYEQDRDFKVDIILRPGFLKYGNDDGEFLERCAVWIPAVLDLTEPGSETPKARDSKSKPSVSALANTPTPRTPPGQPRPDLLNGESATTVEPSRKKPVGSISNELQPDSRPAPEGVRLVSKSGTEQTATKAQATPPAKSPRDPVPEESEGERDTIDSINEKIKRAKALAKGFVKGLLKKKRNSVTGTSR